MSRWYAYWQYVRSPKGAYEWRSYLWAILLWGGISGAIVAIVGAL